MAYSEEQIRKMAKDGYEWSAVEDWVTRQVGYDKEILAWARRIYNEARREELPWEEPKEVVEHGSYVIFTNLDTGETKQYYNINPPDSSEVVSAAMFIKPYLEERWGRNIKFEIVPAEKLPRKPMLPGKPLPEALRPSRPFPETFGDWVDLAEDIKEKRPDLAPDVNENLGYIFTEDPAQSENAKHWLWVKAGEIGIR